MTHKDERIRTSIYIVSSLFIGNIEFFVANFCFEKNIGFLKIIKCSFTKTSTTSKSKVSKQMIGT